MNAIKNITIGHTERLYKPVGYTMLANLVNIVPFCLSIEAIRVIFNAFDGSGQPLDTTRLWWIFGVMAIYTVSYTHLRAHETGRNLVCRLLLEKKKKTTKQTTTRRYEEI